MQVTAKSEYAMRAVLYLALNIDSGWVPARDIASSQHIPPKFLPQILQRLRGAQVIDAARGSKGGFRLLVPPSELTARQVIESIEGPLMVYDCSAERGCVLSEGCTICGLWSDTRNNMLKILSETTFSDLMREPKKSRRGRAAVAQEC